MFNVLKFVKKGFIVLSIFLVVLVGMACCCSSESVEEQSVETTKHELTVEKQESKKNASSITQDKKQYAEYEGKVFIVDTNGTTLGYAHDDYSGVYELEKQYLPEISMGVPYVTWVGTNENEVFIVATAASNGSWVIDETELNKIPSGWQWFLNTAIDKANSY